MFHRFMLCACLVAGGAAACDDTPAPGVESVDDVSERRPLGPDTGRPDRPGVDADPPADVGDAPDVPLADAASDAPPSDATLDPPLIDATDDVPLVDATDDVPLVDATDDVPLVDAADDVPLIDAAPDTPARDIGVDTTTDAPIDAAPDAPRETPLDPAVSVPPGDNEPCDTPGAMFECSGIAICRLYSEDSSRCESCEPCGNLHSPCSASSECDILFTCYEGYCTAMCSFETPQTCGRPTDCIDVGHPTHGVCRRSF